MKINKAKLLVGTLAVAAVAATVGSISGTVAWFQYSTRVTAAYSGAAAHVSENLQIRLSRPDVGTSGQAGYVAGYNTGAEEGWKADLAIADVNAYLENVRGANKDKYLRPVTSGGELSATGKVASVDKLKKSPIYQISSTYDKWQDADVMDYVELPIELRVLDRNGANPDQFLAQDVFMTDLTIASAIQSTDTQHKDITDALRVSFDFGEASGATKVTFSKKGEVVATSGNLDLNADGKLDREKGYEWENPGLFTYGGTAGATSADPITDTFENTTQLVKSEGENLTYWADDTDPADIKGTKLGTTTNDGKGLKFTVRIYLEGWQKLEDKALKAVVDGAESKDYASLAAAVEAANAQENPWVPTENTVYKIGDKAYKFIGGNPITAASFVEIDPMQAVWNDDEYVAASFNVGMRFAVNTHVDH